MSHIAQSYGRQYGAVDEPSSYPRNDGEQGWAATQEDIAARRAVAGSIEGGVIQSVIYVNIDHSRWDLHPTLAGRREITAAAELGDPTWSHPGFHAIDYGIEFHLADDRVFHVTWDSPSLAYSMRIAQGPIASTLAPDQNVAVWDVTGVPPWSNVVGKPVDSVVLQYDEWSDWSQPDGFSLDEVLLNVGEQSVRIVLGDAEFDESFTFSADCIAVML